MPGVRRVPEGQTARAAWARAQVRLREAPPPNAVRGGPTERRSTEPCAPSQGGRAHTAGPQRCAGSSGHRWPRSGKPLTYPPEQRPVGAQPHRHRPLEAQHPLPPRDLRQAMLHQQRRRLGHAPAHAGGAHAPALAREGNAKAVPAAAALRHQEAMLEVSARHERFELVAHESWQRARAFFRAAPETRASCTALRWPRGPGVGQPNASSPRIWQSLEQCDTDANSVFCRLTSAH